MNTDDENTETLKSSGEGTKEFVCMILHLASDTLVICKIAGFSSGMNMVAAQTPLEIFPEYDESGSVESFSLQPYLQPFAIFNEKSMYNINLRQVISITPPNQVMLDTYNNALIQMLSDDGVTDESSTEPGSPETPASDKPTAQKRVLH